MIRAIILISMMLGFGQNAPPFDGKRAMDLLITQCSFGPRFPGSEGHLQMKKFLTHIKDVTLHSPIILPALI